MVITPCHRATCHFPSSSELMSDPKCTDANLFSNFAFSEAPRSYVDCEGLGRPGRIATGSQSLGELSCWGWPERLPGLFCAKERFGPTQGEPRMCRPVQGDVRIEQRCRVDRLQLSVIYSDTFECFRHLRKLGMGRSEQSAFLRSAFRSSWK